MGATKTTVGRVSMIDKINKLISEFNALVNRRNNAEKWFDLTSTSDVDRDKWQDGIFKLNDDIEGKARELELLGFVMQLKFIWYGIMEGLK